MKRIINLIYNSQYSQLFADIHLDNSIRHKGFLKIVYLKISNPV